MDIQTSWYQRIYVLPDNAKCKITGKSPLDMDDCPECVFDFYGDYCIPELCENYTEGD